MSTQCMRCKGSSHIPKSKWRLGVTGRCRSKKLGEDEKMEFLLEDRFDCPAFKRDWNVA